MKRPNVYIVNPSPHDFSPAEHFGDIVFLSDTPFDRYATNRIHRTFLPILECSEPGDYLLITALSVMNIIAASILSVIHGELNLLLYHHKNKEYIHRKLELKDLSEASASDVAKHLRIEESS